MTLTPQARALLADDGGDDGPSAAARARMRSNLLTQIAAVGTAAGATALGTQAAAATAAAATGAGAATAKAAGASGAAGISVAGLSGVGVGKLALGVLLAGGLGWGGWTAVTPAPAPGALPAVTTQARIGPSEAEGSPAAVAARSPSMQPPSASQPAPAHVTTTPPASAQTEPAPAALTQTKPAQTEPTLAKATPSQTTAAPMPPAAGSAATLDAQAELLLQARSAVRTGRHAEGLRLLEVYRSRYGDGALAEERAALQVMALCQQGRAGSKTAAAAGLRAAKQFRQRFPRSPLRSHVDQACLQP